MYIFKFIIYFLNLSIYLISKTKSPIGQIPIKIKHRVKWMVKVVKTRNLPPTNPSPPTWIPSCIWFLHFSLIF